MKCQQCAEHHNTVGYRERHRLSKWGKMLKRWFQPPVVRIVLALAADCLPAPHASRPSLHHTNSNLI